MSKTPGQATYPKQPSPTRGSGLFDFIDGGAEAPPGTPSFPTAKVRKTEAMSPSTFSIAKADKGKERVLSSPKPDVEMADVSSTMSPSTTSVTITTPPRRAPSGTRQRSRTAAPVGAKTTVLDTTFTRLGVTSNLKIPLVLYGGGWIPRYGSKAAVEDGDAYLFGRSTKAAMDNRKHSRPAMRLKWINQMAKGFKDNQESLVTQGIAELRKLGYIDSEDSKRAYIDKAKKTMERWGTMKIPGSQPYQKKLPYFAKLAKGAGSKENVYIRFRQAGLSNQSAMAMITKIYKKAGRDPKLVWLSQERRDEIDVANKLPDIIKEKQKTKEGEKEEKIEVDWH